MKRLIKLIAAVVILLLLAGLGLAFFVNANSFRPVLESSMSDALHREVKLGNLSLSLFSGSVEADDLSISEDPAFGKAPFLQAKAMHVGVELQPLIFSHKLNVTGITIEKPEITLLQSPAGEWNYASLGTKDSAPAAARANAPAPASDSTASRAGLAFSVSKLSISGGKVTIGRTGEHWKPLVLSDVNIDVKDFSPASSFPFSLSSKVESGGAIKLDGKAGPINPADASLIPASVDVNISGLDVAGAGLANYAPEIGGLISLDGTGDTDGTVLKISGDIKAEKLKLAKTGTPATIPVEFNFAAEHNLKKHSGVLKKGDIHIGKAPASLTGSYYEQGQSMMLKMALNAPSMAVSEIVSMLGPLGIVLPSGSSLQDGSLATNLSMEGPLDKLVTNGSLALTNTKLVNFDLGKKMAMIQQIAGFQTGPSTEIQNARAKLQVTPEGIQTTDIQLIVPTIGDLKGGGTISPANALDFKMNVALHTKGVAAIIADKPIPFFVEGTSQNPEFKPDIKGMAAAQVDAVKGQAKTAAGNLLKGIFGGKKP